MLRKVTKFIFIPMLILLFVFLFFSYQADKPLQELKQKYGAFPSQFMDVAGMKVHYRIEGKGEPLVLLHGTGASLHTWDGWTRAMADSFKIIRLDLPAFGLTGPHPNHDYRISTYVNILHSFLKKNKVNKIALAGNSLGGFIAWRYALRYPAQVKKLILIDATGYPNNESPPTVFKLAQTPVIGLLFTIISSRFIIAKSLKEVYADDSKVTSSLIDRYYELSLRPGNRKAFVAQASTKFADHLHRLTQLQIPVLLMWGELDPWTPVRYLESFARMIKNAQIVTYPDLGHVPMEEAPKRTAADARAFLLSSQVAKPALK